MKATYLTQFIMNACSLFAVWLVLSGRYDLPHVMIGGIVACGVAWLNTRLQCSSVHHFSLGRLLIYAPWLLGRIVASSLHITKVILSPSLPIAPKMIHYQMHLKPELAIVLLGNSITLTPGTITVEVE
ncbi:MAG: Na+/H+ antiporter subunit E, partial [Nitrospira sp.]|nr:Na+/H+ antiporter subunit E [Nitrospira sp.]